MSWLSRAPMHFSVYNSLHGCTPPVWAAWCIPILYCFYLIRVRQLDHTAVDRDLATTDTILLHCMNCFFLGLPNGIMHGRDVRWGGGTSTLAAAQQALMNATWTPNNCAVLARANFISFLVRLCFLRSGFASVHWLNFQPKTSWVASMLTCHIYLNM